jgi:subtilase family protein
MKVMNGLAPLSALVAAMAAVMACQSPGGWIRADEQGLTDGGRPPCPIDGGTCVEVSPISSLDGACTNDRLLALFNNPDTTCPSLPVPGGTWDGSKLFAESGAPAIPPALQSYCLYEWDPPMPANPANVAALASALAGSVSALEQDCFVVGPSGSSVGVTAGWSALRDGFHEQTGWLPELPPGANGTTPAKVRVAVVDTAPNYYAAGAPGDDRSGHGHAVGWIIREHACPDTGGTCIGQVADRLAMPRLTVRTRDLLNGGYFGSEGETARGIHGAVHAWRAFKAAGGNQPRLVINLSLGWDPTWGGDPNASSGMPLGARAVYAAITHAVCQGALVIAAAGNDPGGPGVAAGPMYPGGWETQPAPTAAQCAMLEGAGYGTGGTYPPLPPAGSNVYQPLVFAVSGVRANDRLLLNARPGGRARLVAPGAHAVATDGTDPTDVLYGTSAAAAVVSATAADVWGYRPKLTGPEVMDLIRDAGQRLVPSADFCLGGRPCPRPSGDAQVVRVNLCEAIQAACSTGLERCPLPAALPTCAPRPPYADTPPRLTDAGVATMQAAATTTYDATPVDWALAGLATCEDTAILTTGPRYPASPCPKRQYFGTPVRPWTGPQPATNACPVCTIGRQSASSSTYTVTLAIDDEYTTSSLGEPVLRINGEYDVDLSGMGTLDAGDVAVIDNVDLSGVPSVDTAEIQFRLVDETGSYSSESELVVQ